MRGKLRAGFGMSRKLIRIEVKRTVLLFSWRCKQALQDEVLEILEETRGEVSSR